MSAGQRDLAAVGFVAALEARRSADEREKLQLHFKSGAGEYAEGDVFIGVRMGETFALAKEYIDMPLDQIEMLLESPIHEARVGAVSIMDFQARRKRTPDERREELFDLYVRRHDRIDNWDLVDRSAPTPRPVLWALVPRRATVWP